MKPHIAIIAVIAVALLGIVPSGVTQWYLQYPYFDKVMHFAGGFAIAWLVATLLTRRALQKSVGQSLLVIVGITLAVGVAWEIAEYISNKLFADAVDGIQATIWRYYHGGNLKDSLLDLVADVAGALVLSGIYLPLARKK